MWGKLRPCFLDLESARASRGGHVLLVCYEESDDLCKCEPPAQKGSLRQTHAPLTAKASGKKEHLVVGFQLSSFMRQTEPYPLRGSLGL